MLLSLLRETAGRATFPSLLIAIDYKDFSQSLAHQRHRRTRLPSLDPPEDDVHMAALHPLATGGLGITNKKSVGMGRGDILRRAKAAGGGDPTPMWYRMKH
ncbi:hypothetical protein FA95DRAFT_564763 [Auriscalpium vulgare]|uniref:Uncharacterized protein n=1 Tax=Auriscalpium vulgare TaxID=40419 RepID=A0ACB8REC3_9AGAM|nr:hypothetical protein FA95DRAFT_564763 [Auriscalpium vulgare]